MNWVNPRAHIKNRTTFSKNVLVLLYKNIQDAMKNLFKNELPQVESIAFTSDLWNSEGSDDYVSLTMHYISPAWKMRRFVIGCRDFEGRHTGAAIARQLDAMVRDIPHVDLDRMVTSMTTDSASNMVKAFDSSPPESMTIKQHFKCVDHAINNCIKDALAIPDVKLCVKRCKKLAKAVHRSNLKNTKVREKCAELGGKLKFYIWLA